MSAAVNRLRASEVLIALGSLGLLACMFLCAWYRIKVPGLFGAYVNAAGVQTSTDAWDSLRTIRWLLLATALAGVGLVLLIILRAGRWQAAAAPALLVGALGAACATLVFYRIVVDGPFAHAEVKLGAWLGFACSLLIACGGVRALLAQGAVSPVARAVESAP